MIIGLARYGWLLLVRSVAAALFGIMALTWPAITLMVLLMLLGAYVFMHGILALYVGMQVRRDVGLWWMMTPGDWSASLWGCSPLFGVCC